MSKKGKRRKERQEYVDPVVEEYKKKSPIEAGNTGIRRVFSKYKMITYVFFLFCPPYALYRLWCEKTQFHIDERIAYTFVCVFLTFVYIRSFF